MAATNKAARKSAPAKVKAAADPGAEETQPGGGVQGSAADVVDAQLAKYRSMRDFHITEEPAGKAKDGTAKGVHALPFCIQKHAASHLHYDFRLGWNGVLKSWAVAKGPSYFTGDKRLAVQVEDHPMEYGGFEGIIPKGQYGGGTVMLWDQGTWEPQPEHEDVNAGLRDGSLKFVMHGTKMKGKWTLVRMGGRAATGSKPNWLLIKEHDEFERGKDDPCVTEAEPDSVATGRGIEEIARNEDHVWNSKETAGTGQAWYRKVGAGGAGVDAASASANGGKKSQTSVAAAKATGRTAPKTVTDLAKRLPDLPKERQPEFVKPQLAQEGTEPPEGAGWLHELKLDGYRMQARLADGKVEMLTRSGLDWTYRVPAVAAAVARLGVKAATLDGEVVVLREDGTTNFADLQASFQEGARNPLTFFCFDLLHLDGRNTREMPLRARKELLGEVLAGGDGDEVRLSEHIEGNGAAMFESACKLHAEGIVSKRAAGPYHAGRSGDWLKSKCLREQEFVVGGYTVSSDGEDRVGSLLLGYYEGGKLVYSGRTGTGFTQKARRMLMERLQPMKLSKPAYASVPAEAKRDAVWVRPELVAQVRFATWTADDLVRQASFQGLREDKAPGDVRREEASVAPKPKAAKAGRQKSGAADKLDDPAAAVKSEGAEEPPAAKVGEKFYVRPRNPESPTEKARAAEEKAKAAERKLSATHKPTSGADAAAKTASVAIEHAPVRLTHPAKVLDQSSGVTKQVLADYYWAVADRMLPHIAGRPLSLVRCPEGSEKPCFYQKHVNHMLPKGVGSVDVPNKKEPGSEPYITLDSKEALSGLAQMGVLEVHPWGSRNLDLERPDRLTFDLDPDESLGWATVTAAAAEVRKRLKAIGLESFLKTTGGKGLHIVVPIEPEMEFSDAKQFAKDFVVSMERANPALYLTKMTKAARTGKIYLDYLRNERGATAVAPYSPRARAGMGVSVPLAWSELESEQRPVFRVAEFAEWNGRLKKDPWKGMADKKQRVTTEARRAVLGR